MLAGIWIRGSCDPDLPVSLSVRWSCKHWGVIGQLAEEQLDSHQTFIDAQSTVSWNGKGWTERASHKSQLQGSHDDILCGAEWEVRAAVPVEHHALCCLFIYFLPQRCAVCICPCFTCCLSNENVTTLFRTLETQRQEEVLFPARHFLS